jgi:palmitoyl transferase
MKVRAQALAAALVLASGSAASAQPAGGSSGVWSSMRGTLPGGVAEPSTDETRGFWSQTGEGLKTIWTGGGSDIFVPGYLWHMPWKYSDEQIARYNTAALGLGYGRTLRGAGSRPRMVYGVVSADSYSRLQYMVGYAWRARWRPGRGAFSFGGGYTAMLIGRYDRFRYAPIPIALPLGSIGVDRLELMGAYVPGFEVTYLFLKVNVGTGQ